MNASVIDVKLRQLAGRSWSSDAIRLPGSRVAIVQRADGSSIPFDVADGSVLVEAATGDALYARVELTEALVATSDLDRLKLEVDRAKIVAEERGARRTVWISLMTGIVTAAATIAVAWIGHAGDQKAATLHTYGDLVECRESLSRLASLATLDQQTVPTLRDAIARHLQSCRDRLDAAISASQP